MIRSRTEAVVQAAIDLLVYELRDASATVAILETASLEALRKYIQDASFNLDSAERYRVDEDSDEEDTLSPDVAERRRVEARAEFSRATHTSLTLINMFRRLRGVDEVVPADTDELTVLLRGALGIDGSSLGYEGSLGDAILSRQIRTSTVPGVPQSPYARRTVEDPPLPGNLRPDVDDDIPF